MLENTSLENYKLVISENNNPIAVQINGEIRYRLYDYVLITSDVRGYICPGISHEGIGQIVEIRRDMTDHFFGVRMDNGEFGFIKSRRLSRVFK